LSKILPLLPEIMPRWGKVQIVDGDSIRTASVSIRGEEIGRDNSFVRKHMPPNNEMAWVPQLCYGRLDEILVFKLPNNKVFGAFSEQTRLLAVLTPCSTAGKDAAHEIVSHTQTNHRIIADLQSVSAVIGRMATRGKWVIIDRTGGLIKPEFAPAAQMQGEPGEVED
ncbi:hypothetical protein K438DRAFT_1613118, partial [Mycena galopus ATCC 62051]